MEHKITENTIRLSTIEKHIFKVAKNHYGNKEDSIDMLIKIINKVCWISGTTDFTIFEMVSQCFNEYVDPIHRRDALSHAFQYGFERNETTTYRNLTLWMLGAISTIKIVNENKELIYDMEAEVLNLDEKK